LFPNKPTRGLSDIDKKSLEFVFKSFEDTYKNFQINDIYKANNSALKRLAETVKKKLKDKKYKSSHILMMTKILAHYDKMLKISVEQQYRLSINILNSIERIVKDMENDG